MFSLAFFVKCMKTMALKWYPKKKQSECFALCLISLRYILFLYQSWSFWMRSDALIHCQRCLPACTCCSGMCSHTGSLILAWNWFILQVQLHHYLWGGSSKLVGKKVVRRLILFFWPYLAALQKMIPAKMTVCENVRSDHSKTVSSTELALLKAPISNYNPTLPCIFSIK